MTDLDTLTALQAQLTEARSCVEQAAALRDAAIDVSLYTSRLPTDADEKLKHLDWKVKDEMVRRATHRGFLAEADELEAKARLIVAAIHSPPLPA